jgi:GTP 3',8-cyclase / cyclic pyranopterin monophosphate synthase
MKLTDSFGRIHDYIRISLIDKCNLNCIYCNPQNQPVNSSKRDSILSYEELIRLITILVRDLGVRKIRFTGGEPLLRKNILTFFQMLSVLRKEYPFEIGITTNGTQLEDKIESLYSFGADRINISLDTLQRNRFIAITGKDMLETTLRSIDKAIQLNFQNVKINAVSIKNINNDELLDFIEHFQNTNLNIRFIEYMPFSGNGWDDTKFISWEEMKSVIESKFKLYEMESDSKLSKDFALAGSNLKVGFISSISNHFCDSCDRLRITASGKIKNCLFSQSKEINLKQMLQDSSNVDNNIAIAILESLQDKWLEHPSSEELINLQHNNMMSIGG